MDKVELTLAIIGIVVSLLSVVATLFLGFVAFYQNKKLNNINNRLMKQGEIKDTYSYMEPSGISISRDYKQFDRKFLNNYSNCLRKSDAEYYHFIFFQIEFENLTKFKGCNVFVHEISLEFWQQEDPLSMSKFIKFQNLEKINFKHRLGFNNQKQKVILPFTIAWTINDFNSKQLIEEWLALDKKEFSVTISYINSFNVLTSCQVMMFINKGETSENGDMIMYNYELNNFGILDTKFNYYERMAK